MEVDVRDKCRACLSENESMFSLFDVYEHDLTLAMILQSCVSTQVSKDDGLPSQLCEDCILILTQFYNFTVIYEENEKQLQSLTRDNKELVQKYNADISGNDDVNLATAAIPNKYLQLNNAQQCNVVVAENAEDDCGFQDNFGLFQCVNAALEEQQVINAENSSEKLEILREFKKEVTNDGEDDSNENNVHAYLELLVDDKAALIKEEIDGVKSEEAYYEEITKYECTICGEAHLYASSFQQHMRLKHNIADVNCEQYASTVRLKMFNSYEDGGSDNENFLQPNADESNREICCKVCSKQFSHVSQLYQHTKIHQNNKKFVCEICGARFIRKTYLDDHKEGHSNERNHVCKFCGKAFRRRTVLRAHKRVHTHPNHYVCEICGRAFTNSSTLKTHKLLIHIKERNFKCVICNLTFPLKSTLNKHVRRHQKRENGEKGFNCNECEMEYRDKSSLKRHIETKHQGQVPQIECPDCPKKYTSKANLMKHQKKHHAVDMEGIE